MDPGTVSVPGGTIPYHRCDDVQWAVPFDCFPRDGKEKRWCSPVSRTSAITYDVSSIYNNSKLTVKTKTGWKISGRLCLIEIVDFKVRKH